MAKINLLLPISGLYTQGPLALQQNAVPVAIELTAGDHLFISEPTEIGHYFHYPVFAQMRFPYSYDPETQFVTIAGPDDTSDRQLSIYTSLEQHPGTIDMQSLNRKGGTVAVHNLWSAFTARNTEVRQVNKMLIRQAIDTLVQQLLDAGVQGVIQTGTAPVVTPENYQDYKAMFLPEKEEVLVPSLADIFAVQHIVDSTYGGTITWTLNYSFANVDGSTDDPYPKGYNSWIKLWADKCNSGDYPSHCSSYNYSDGKNNYTCGSSFVGGHVIPGTKVQKVKTGGTAYIFPICSGHNNNDNIYMSMRYNPIGVILNNYMQSFL